jgi:predicted amidohydrolase
VQHDIVWEDPPQNFARLAPLVAEAADAGARLVALTEMYATGFSMAAGRIAEDATGPSATFLAEQAQRHGVWVCASVPTKARPGAPSVLPTNSFVLAAPHGVVQRYDKLHPFSYDGEHEHYGAGERASTFDVEGVRMTPFVCYDLRFADVWWAKAAATDLFVCVANWPAARRTHWQTLLRARAIENQAYVLGVNRVGQGVDRSGAAIEYVGDSVVVDPLGELVASSAPGVEQVITAEVDPQRVADVRSSFPFLRDRRSEPFA